MSIKNLFSSGTGSLLVAGLFLVSSCGPADQSEVADEDPMDDQMQEDLADDIQPEPQQPNMADVEVTDEDLRKFVEAMSEIEVIQQDFHAQMQGILADEGLDENKFNQLRMEEHGMAQEDAPNIDDADRESYQTASGRIQELEQDLDEEAMGVLEDHGLSFERYQEIMMALQADPELQQQYQELIEEQHN